MCCSSGIVLVTKYIHFIGLKYYLYNFQHFSLIVLYNNVMYIMFVLEPVQITGLYL